MLRKERGLTLADVAAATGISTSFLSLVETGRSDITLGRLFALVKFYETSIEELLPEDGSHDRSLVRADDREHWQSPSEGMDVYLLSPDTERTMMPMLVHFAPHSGLVEYAEHEGEEFIHVLEGALEVTVEDKSTTLLEGDSFYFASDRPHRVRNTTDSTTTIVQIVSPPPRGRGPGGSRADSEDGDGSAT